MKTTRIIVVAAFLGGCLGAVGEQMDPGPSDLPPDPGATDPGTNPPITPPMNQCAVGRTYIGFDGNPLQAGRQDGEIGADRLRIKPFSALAGEYQRVLGATPASLAAKASSFASDPPRWSSEPFASAVSLYTLLEVNFQGCNTLIGTQAQYAAAPNATTAATECTNFATKFWNRAPTQAEIDACVKVAVNDTTSETDVRKRWGYACAAVLTAAGFVSY